MKTFETIIIILTSLAIVISITEVYLKVNKIWKRKHDREVAASQSVLGLLLSFFTMFIWFIYYLIKNEYAGMMDNVIFLAETIVFMLIGTGLWVKGQEHQSIWKLIRQAIKFERKEADYLIKRFFKPQNAESIINILHQLAMIDEELNEKEKVLIESFAREWNIDYSADKLNRERDEDFNNNFIRLRNSVIKYLDREPNHEQVAQLKDMMTAIINADDKITDEEDLIVSELMGILENYLKKDNGKELYHVLIVPQKPSHEELIKTLLPDSIMIRTAGGIAYSIGRYYSYKYADMICRQYRQVQLFTIVFGPESGEEFIAEEKAESLA